MTVPTFEQAKEGYNNLYNKMLFTRATAINDAAKVIINNKDKYKAVEAKTGVPWYWIGAIHMRESSNDFRGVLHNGERIIGTGKKTTLVPAGRGPFSTWEEAAIDAITHKGLHKIKKWDVARMGYQGEAYNGWGYLAHGVNSPYLWGGTNLQQPGKYIADGVWSSTAVDKQLGIMPVIYKVRELEKITSTVVVEDKQDKPPVTEQPKSNWFIRLLKLLFVKGK